ncbi:hypothetical protein HOA55_02550 [archaeon]|jgi:HTH-type transcriptional regulator, sugar sensing transcriptional regulator|nr:hypothetical protein [archaeon]MBT3577199.1 hypothetical protein [archaeon]MBT6820208.1 hypothetical protein [archaeon]MBT6956220.1 hypothetical protein [archaeon]MBT7025413.1 hypothetical protein [archaeon]
MNLEVLKEAGLNEGEIKAYLACLRMDSSTAAEITRNAGLDRSNGYSILERLIKKGLISTVKKNKKTYFEAGDPKQLLEKFKSRESELKTVVKELELQKKMTKAKKQGATIYEGYAGIKQVFEDILDTLNPGDEYLVFGAIDIPEVFERYVLHWTKRRLKKKLKLKIIYNKEAVNFIQESRKNPLTSMKVLPKEYITPAVVNVYGNKTATIVWAENPIAFVVENKDYADSFRDYFKMLWKLAGK